MKRKILLFVAFIVVVFVFLYGGYSLLVLNLKKENEELKKPAYNNKIDVPFTPTITQESKNFMDATVLTLPSADLNLAMNKYRTSHGVSEVSINQELCDYGLKRAQDMRDMNAGKVLNENGWDKLEINHDRIDKDVKSGAITNYIHGKSEYGENIATAICKLSDASNDSIKIMTATDLTRCFDSSPKHKEVLLDSIWTDGCSVGRFPFYVEIFAK